MSHRKLSALVVPFALSTALAGAEPDRWAVVDASQAPETVHTLIAARVLALPALQQAQIR